MVLMVLAVLVVFFFIVVGPRGIIAFGIIFALCEGCYCFPRGIIEVIPVLFFFCFIFYGQDSRVSCDCSKKGTRGTISCDYPTPGNLDHINYNYKNAPNRVLKKGGNARVGKGVKKRLGGVKKRYHEGVKKNRKKN